MVKLGYGAATLVLIGCGALALASCNKEKPGTEVPAGDDAGAADGGAADGDAAGSDEPEATTGADHEAMTDGDTADGGDTPPADG